MICSILVEFRLTRQTTDGSVPVVLGIRLDSLPWPGRHEPPVVGRSRPRLISNFLSDKIQPYCR
jgi:hypothetical protein